MNASCLIQVTALPFSVLSGTNLPTAEAATARSVGPSHPIVESGLGARKSSFSGNDRGQFDLT